MTRNIGRNRVSQVWVPGARNRVSGKIWVELPEISEETRFLRCGCAQKTIISVLPLREAVLGEFEKKLGWGGCANGDKFAILIFTAGVTQLVE
ncbi:hypothetical protein [Tychonema sp. LEGE 07203]|uniref:hypothetical protein n=1 Tax=Tychonema sp. LEGE 07203 TaxID=1828671 RepID=UPI0018807052|nr:hypothetical protein [Tychonema sp. LEGE 07203]MBE9096676.1 hypothetical protein [Tychonema sp. LEGE 07203]